MTGVPQPDEDFKKWPPELSHHVHNWGGNRNYCTLCDKWSVDAETERRIRADERQKIADQLYKAPIKTIISHVIFNEPLAPGEQTNV